MDELVIEGKTYVPAKLAAREYHYAPDYIGQLIRAGKVSGQKMGRSWYVDRSSLKTYLKIEDKAPEVPEGVPEIKSPTPLPSSAAVGRVEIREAPKPLLKTEEYPFLTYLKDDEPSLPTLMREKEREEAEEANSIEIPIRRVEEVEAEILKEEAISTPQPHTQKEIGKSGPPFLLPAAAGAALSFLFATGLLAAASALTSQELVFDAGEGIATVTYSTNVPLEEMTANILSAWRESF